MKILKNNRGFSLVEVIISLVILAVLVTYGYSSLSDYYRYENILSDSIKYSNIIDEINEVVFEKFTEIYTSAGEQRLPRMESVIPEEQNAGLCEVEAIEDVLGDEVIGFSGRIGTAGNGAINVVSSWLFEKVDEDSGRNIGANNFNYRPKEQMNNLYWKDYNRCLNREHAASVTSNDGVFSIEFCVAVEPADQDIVLHTTEWISMQPIFIKYVVQFKNPINKNNVGCSDLVNFSNYLAELKYTVHWIDYSSSSDSYKNMMGSVLWSF